MSIIELPDELRVAYVKYGYTLFLDAADEIDRLRLLVKREDVIPLQIRIPLIIDVVERTSGLPAGGIMGDGFKLIRMRHIAMYICYHLGKHPVTEIGRRFGKNHATVIAALRSMKLKMDKDPDLASHVDHLMKVCFKEAQREKRETVEKFK